MATELNPLNELPVEAPVQPEVADPTIFEPAYWDADDVAIGIAWKGLIDPRTGLVPYERKDQLQEFDHNLSVHNRLHIKELALQIGTLMTAVAAFNEAQAAQEEPKPIRKRAVKVPKAILLEMPEVPEFDGPDAAQ